MEYSNFYSSTRRDQLEYKPRSILLLSFLSGALFAVVGFFAYERSATLYAATRVTTPSVLGDALVSQRRQIPRSAVLYNLEQQTYQNPQAGAPLTPLAPRSYSSLSLGSGILLCGALAWAFATGVFRGSSAPKWTMAAAGEALPDPEEVVAARQKFLHDRGLEGGEDAPEDDVVRSVQLSAGEAPVDLEDMYKQFEAMLGGTKTGPESGDMVEGTIIDIDDHGASVDIGGKTLGYCPLEEMAMFRVEQADAVVTVGERRRFAVAAQPERRRRWEEDLTILSLKSIVQEVAWKRLQQHRENDVGFSVVIQGRNRGGYMVEAPDFGLPGFLPKSQAVSELATAPDDADPEAYVGKVIDVKVLDLDSERQRLVVSQRAANPMVASDTFQVGSVHEATVQNVKPYGVFVDINGVSGLLHISQISHNRVEFVDQLFTVGEKIKCMVLSQDMAQGRLALSTKRLEPTHGDMLTNPALVYEKAEEMAARFREDIAEAERRMQEFEAKLAEQSAVVFE